MSYLPSDRKFVGLKQICPFRRALGASLTSLFLVVGCSETGEGFQLFGSNQNVEEEQTSTRLVERDVEAPEVFQVTENGLWDGRPSLGGVWVAHPDVREPERVIIRNTKNSKFVIGALFRRERDIPGPAVQVSSDAAAALDMLAGSPAQLNVTALRRESMPVSEDPENAPTADFSEPGAVEATSLDPVTTASAAIEEAESTSSILTQASSLEKPYIQIGIFSVEQNALNSATSMRQNGMLPTIKKQKAKGKTFWRVIVGPAATKSERSALLSKIRGMGFEDAYAVTN